MFDSTNNVFYAGTYNDYDASYVYQYNRATGTWNTEATGTTAGVLMVNAYGAQAHNGQLYVAGLAEPWNGGYGQDNYVFAYDHGATPGGATPRHDMLIQTSGNSAADIPLVWLWTAPATSIMATTASRPAARRFIASRPTRLAKPFRPRNSFS
ncbi:MAG: hypothetical protein ABFC77_13535 [Thermoguttaceae bacterium]